MIDPATGGCFDGLLPDGVNRNQGAESTIAGLLTFQLASQREHPDHHLVPTHATEVPDG